MNTRRRIVIAFGAGPLAAPLASFAQRQPGKVARIGWLGACSASGYVREMDAIRARLRELGYLDGRDIEIEYRWAEGNPERLKAMAAELVALKVDVIVSHALVGARAAVQATRTIPIVIGESADPVAAGLVASFARPGRNITGSTSSQDEMQAKRLRLLKQALPRIARVALLFDANDPLRLDDAQAAAKTLKVHLHPFSVRETGDFPGAFNAMAKTKVDAALINETPLPNSNAVLIAALAASHRIPISGITNIADAGGLLAYGSNRTAVFGRAADFVDRILKGAKPGDLPIERTATFELVVNLKTSKALGIKILNSIRLQATRVIE